MLVWIYMMKIWIKYLSFKFNKNVGYNLIGIPEKPDGTLSDHKYFELMIIYFIIFNQLTKIETSCGSLYQMNKMIINLRVKQQRYTMTRSTIRRGVLPKNHPSILSRERDKKNFTTGTNYLMTSV